jgi:hypothetical protein
MARAKTVAVVVPSPAASFVLLATSWTRLQSDSQGMHITSIDRGILTEHRGSRERAIVRCLSANGIAAEATDLNLVLESDRLCNSHTVLGDLWACAAVQLDGSLSRERRCTTHTSIRLLDDHSPAPRTECDRDGLCKDLYTREHRRTGIVGELGTGIERTKRKGKEPDRTSPYLYFLVRKADVLQAALGEGRGTHRAESRAEHYGYGRG